MMHLRPFTLGLLVASFAAMAWSASGPQVASPPPAAEAEVASTLDAFHAAAARADEAAYFDLIAPQGVFLGTDAGERWEKEAFRAFARPHFSQGKGWTFVPRDRHVALTVGGTIAWFDELLDSASYGECRGTGVLEKADGRWRILQYHLTIPVPNDLAKEVVARIRERSAPPADAPR